ncbi:MAG: hypothetical protein ACOYM3_16885 [Terrimicrobiaceae bacterium]
MRTKTIDSENESLRRSLCARMVAVGMSRKELASVTGLSMSVIHGALAGFRNPGNAARRLIEVAIGIPVWSAPEEFNSLTQLLNRHPQQFLQTTQQIKTEK